MLTLILWSAGVILEGLILFRSIRAKTLAKYPFFFAYVACVFFVDTSRYITYSLSPATYSNWYWGTEFLSLLMGYGVILEILNKTLTPYAGAERFARILVVGIFAAVFSFVLYQARTAPEWSPAASLGALERDLRAVQAVVLAGILVILFHYRIVIGKNTKGMILGYGFYIATSMMSLAIRAYAGATFESAWQLIQPYCYLFSLWVWTVALWSYHPNPVAQPAAGVEADYESLALRTREKLGAMRSYFERTARP